MNIYEITHRVYETEIPILIRATDVREAQDNFIRYMDLQGWKHGPVIRIRQV